MCNLDLAASYDDDEDWELIITEAIHSVFVVPAFHFGIKHGHHALLYNAPCIAWLLSRLVLGTAAKPMACTTMAVAKPRCT